MKLPFPETILHQHSATLGKTGAGKSSALRVSVEHLLDQRKRVIIIDPKGDWWGLKASADGKGAGYPVITFGNFKNDKAADVPINERSGKHVAELIASGNRPCVIGFRGWMPSQMMNFWVGQQQSQQADGFAPTLFNRNEGELYLFIDEVQNFAPKGKTLSPQAGMCLHWTNKMAAESRGLGITLHIASQRSQKVHNDTLDCCETLFAMRVTHTAARDAVEAWINSKGDPKLGKEVLSTLAELQRGEAWTWSPENDFGPKRVQFPMFSTFDSFAPPQLQKKVSQAGWSEVDLDQVKQKLATVIAEAKANDPKELKAEIARLRAELSKAKVAAPVERVVPAEPKIIEVPVVKDDQIKELSAAVDAIRSSAASLSQAADQLAASLAQASKKPAMPIRPAVSKPMPRPAPVQRSPQTRAVPVVSNNGELSGPEQNILNQLAELEVLGIPQPEKLQLGLMAGYTNVRSGGFSEPMGRLVEIGFARYPRPGSVALTEEGRVHAQSEGAPLDTQELHDRLCRKLGRTEARLLREVIALYPEEITKEELGARLGYTNVRSGGFSEPIGRLRSLGIIEYPQPGTVKASEWLFVKAA